MWRGVPDNRRTLRFAKSMINTGFRKDSVIAARSLDLSSDGSPVTFRLLFGDGSARGVAACLVWTLIINRLDMLSADDEWVDSLLSITTSFEVHGDGSQRASLIAQAARQNQAAQQLPVNTIEWVGMVRPLFELAVHETLNRACGPPPSTRS